MQQLEERPLRVLISAESFVPAVNGVTNSVLRSARHLVERDHCVRILAPGPGENSVDIGAGLEVAVDRVRAFTVPRYPDLRFGVAARERVRSVMASFRPDLVHLAAPFVLGHQVGLAARQLDVPAVAVFQTDLSGFATNYGLKAAAIPIWSWLRAIHNRADLTLAPTKTVAGELDSQGFHQVGIWGRGVDHEQFHPRRRSEELRRGFGVTPGDVLVGYVGRLAAEKRVELLRALVDLAGVKLVIVGDGPERPTLERLLPHAYFTGMLQGEDLGATVASLDILVHAGMHETFCQTLQEAMACSVAVVAPRAGGPIDLVDHGIDGLLYEPGDGASLLVAVARLIHDPNLRRTLAEAGHRRVAGRTWQTLGDELIGHYRRMTAPVRLAA